MKQKNILLLMARYNHRSHKGVAEYAGQNKWHLNCDMVSTLQVPSGWAGDGIICVLDYQPELIEFVRKSGVPTVDLSVCREDIPMARISGDNRAMGRMAAEHFLARGFNHFAWFSNRDDPIAAQRREGYGGYLAEHDFTYESLVWENERGEDPDNWDRKQAWLSRRLSELPHPLALYAFNDYQAANVIDACIQSGLRVPDDIAVLGSDNNELICDCLSIPLSSINHDLERVGYEGARLLDRLMRGESPPSETILIPPRGITLRRSTDIIAVSHSEVARSLHFLQDNFHRDIHVRDVVAVSNLSRRGLEKAFEQVMNRSIHDELVRIRLNRAMEYLAKSDLPVQEISQLTGFSRPQYFCNFFRKAVGMTPRKYRLKYRPTGR
jgi:LacI family transcriptional regulator